MTATHFHALARRRAIFAVSAMLFAGCAGAELHSHDNDDDSLEIRTHAERRIHWRDANAGKADAASQVEIKLLGINDFHGQLSTGRRVANRPVGGAAVLGAYLRAAQSGMERDTTIVHAGDHVGASPPASALLQDEPAISFLNLLANTECRYAEPENERDNEADNRRDKTNCNIVGTLGNHEFDEGQTEMRRLVRGGNHAKGPFLESPYRGARFPYVSANVVDKTTGEPIFAPYTVRRMAGVPVAFIGAVLKETPTIVTPTGIANLRFLDEATAINRYVAELKADGVRAIVVTIHQGGRQPNYLGATKPTAAVTGAVADIVAQLDDEVDVVISGHAHAFTNALLKNRNGKEILVTQAFSAGTAYADIALKVDRRTRDVVEKSAAVITTFGDAGPGLIPDPAIAQLVADAEAKVAPLVERVIGSAAHTIAREQNAAGESALGNLIADAQRAATSTNFAFMNAGGIRADIDAGPITWGELFTVQPFANDLVTMSLTGAQIYALLNQQWQNQPFPRLLKISGLSYTWDNARAVGDRVIEIRANGAAIDPAATYTVTVNSFLAGGGDNFPVLTHGTNRVVGPVDLDALIAYIETAPQPVSAAIEGRIQRLN